MDKLPTHLEKILRVTESSETTLDGRIVCECGCKTFGIRYFGESYPPHCIGVNEYSGKYALTVRAVCRECGKEWELFDYAKHGYDGFICEDGVSVPNEELIDAAADNERDFEVKIGIEFDDEEQFVEEIVEDPPEGMSFAPDDRVNIWSWVVIDLKCAKSGKKLKGFVDSELA
ncbi:MAG: hypothetical protein K2J80_12265 [Oscillospiraceae bacterium]|nr:hypothetical protein [Oscillospiraceae bacterium]